jgi:predicted DNA-binding transcriptional regulator AlpA
MKKPVRTQSSANQKKELHIELPDSLGPARRKRSERNHRIRQIEPDFITKVELAHHMGCAVSTIDNWVKEGTIPSPYASPGTRHQVWLRKHYKHFRDTGTWPREAYS